MLYEVITDHNDPADGVTRRFLGDPVTEPPFGFAEQRVVGERYRQARTGIEYGKEFPCLASYNFV